jgi:hypothetical protein
MNDGSKPGASADLEMADLNESDGRFTVPGVEGRGIRPGKYRIAVIETYRRETVDKINGSGKPKKGSPRLNDEKNLLDSTFGETTSPFVRDLSASTELSLDMASPGEPPPSK